MTTIVWFVWGQAVIMAMNLGGWHGWPRALLWGVLVLGSLLAFRPRRRDENVDNEAEL